MNTFQMNPMQINPVSNPAIYPQGINPYLKQTQYTPATTPSNGINWVQGIEGAKAWQMSPNSNTVLMDSETDRLYVKTCDAYGMCNIKRYKLIEEADTPAKEAVPELSEYVRKDELEAYLNKLLGGESNVNIQANANTAGN